VSTLPIIELSLLQQIQNLVEIPDDFAIYATALDDPIEQGVIISEKLIWIVFKGIGFTNTRTSPPTSSVSISYSVYVAVQETGCETQHHSASQYVRYLISGLFNSVPRCLDDLFTFSGSGWLINSVNFVTRWSSSHYVYRLDLSLPMQLNLDTCTTVSGVVNDDNCDVDNPFDPDCYIDYENQTLVCPDGVKPLLQVKIGLWRNQVEDLGSDILKDFQT
jgi:hypothetical protein